jgi:hypothetical protein
MPRLQEPNFSSPVHQKINGFTGKVLSRGELPLRHTQVSTHLAIQDGIVESIRIKADYLIEVLHVAHELERFACQPIFPLASLQIEGAGNGDA